MGQERIFMKRKVRGSLEVNSPPNKVRTLNAESKLRDGITMLVDENSFDSLAKRLY